MAGAVIRAPIEQLAGIDPPVGVNPDPGSIHSYCKGSTRGDGMPCGRSMRGGRRGDAYLIHGVFLKRVIQKHGELRRVLRHPKGR